VFATSIHFHPSLIFAGKARSLQSELCPVRGSTLVGTSLASKYQARVELTHLANTLAFYTATITAIKSFIVQAPGIIVIKTFTAVIYKSS
jgi:hypothetical protein